MSQINKSIINRIMSRNILKLPLADLQGDLYKMSDIHIPICFNCVCVVLLQWIMAALIQVHQISGNAMKDQGNAIQSFKIKQLV